MWHTVSMQIKLFTFGIKLTGGQECIVMEKLPILISQND